MPPCVSTGADDIHKKTDKNFPKGELKSYGVRNTEAPNMFDKQIDCTYNMVNPEKKKRLTASMSPCNEVLILDFTSAEFCQWIEMVEKLKSLHQVHMYNFPNPLQRNCYFIK